MTEGYLYRCINKYTLYHLYLVTADYYNPIYTL